MEKNKRYQSYNYLLVLVIIAFLFALTSSVLSIIFADQQILFAVLSICFVLGALTALIIRMVLVHKKNECIKQDINQINEALVNYNQGIEAKLNLDNNLFKEVGENINHLSMSYKKLINHHLYEDNFFDFVKEYFKYNPDIRFAYIRFIGHIEIEELNALFPEAYYGRHNNDIDVVTINYFSKETLLEELKKYLTEHEENICKVVFYPEVKLNDLVDEIEKLEGEWRLQINKNNKSRLDLVSLIDEYMKDNYSSEALLSKFIKEAFVYLPYTHMSILVNGEYLRLATYKQLDQMKYMEKENFYVLERRHLLNYLDKTVEVEFASVNDLKEFDHVDQDNERLFLLMLSNLITMYLDQSTQASLNKKHHQLLDYIHAYNYTIDGEYNIKSVSPLLGSKFSSNIKNLKCYQALYDLDEPCEHCPLVKGNNSHLATFLGSGEYQNIAFANEDKYDLYLFDNNTHVVGSRALLEERLLSLINNESKGYLFVFKLDNLETLASKNKVDKEIIVNQMLDYLRKYHLDNNLYRKEEDEFVYILQEASKEDAVRLGNHLSNCLNEKVLANTRLVNLSMKTILLSYPLEVSTLFALDSLSRSLFVQADKKGRLYRLDEDPTPIDKHKYYLEILENSFKKDEIPLIISNILDKNHKDHVLKMINLDYKEESMLPIKEDEITLVAKQVNYYGTLYERIIKQLNYDKGNEYVLELAREGMNVKLIDALATAIKRKKAHNSQIIFLMKEKDYYSHLNELDHAKELGFKFALFNISLLPNEYKDIYFVKIDENRLEKDIVYQNKVNSIKGKVDILAKGYELEKE